MKKILFPLFLISLFVACKNEAVSDLKEIDLLSYDVPLAVPAPEGAVVKVEDQTVQKEISITKGKEFGMLIWASDVLSNSIEELKAEKIGQDTMKRDFSKIIQNDADGYLFELKMDSTRFNYDFRHFKIMQSKEFLFRAGYSSFTKEQAMKMYNAARAAN